MSENMYGDTSQRPESPLGEPVVTSKNKAEPRIFIESTSDGQCHRNCISYSKRSIC